MAESLFTSQTPTSSGNDNEHSLGNKFTYGVSGRSASRGRIWVPSGGLAATNCVWQLWNADTATMLAQFDLTTLSSPTPNTWCDWFDITPVSISTGVNYIVCWHMPADPGYVFSDFTFPWVSGDYTSSTGVYSTAEASTVMPTNEYAGIYFADVWIASGGVEGTIELASETDSAFSFTGTTAVSGSVALATENDSAFAWTGETSVDAQINTAVENDTAFAWTPGGGDVTTSEGDLTATYYANDLANTLEDNVPTLTEEQALVEWATDEGSLTNSYGLTDIGALNEAFADNPPPDWESKNHILNKVAGTTDLSDQGALREIDSP